MTTAAEVIAAARGWIGTPFHHLGRLKGVGVDCAGLVIGVARDLGLIAPDFDIPVYSRRPDGHSMLAWCDQYMHRVDQMQIGNVIVVIVDKDPQHLGIVTDHRNSGFGIIHAASRSDGTGSVIETRLMFSRAMRFVRAYRLPGVE